MQYTIEELRQKLYSKVYETYGIFKDYFGEERTDLQKVFTDAEIETTLRVHDCGKKTEEGKWEISDEEFTDTKEVVDSNKPFILVYWPEVTITNEHDRSVVIQDLYARIEVTTEGRIPYENRGFQLNRTTFPAKQFGEGYVHSHVPSFSGVPHFGNPCLGRGPINGTILNLKNDFDAMSWMMFCQELAMYVTVESLTGVPYNYLENIGKKNGSKLYDYQNYSDNTDLSRFYDSTEEEAFFEMIRSFSLYYLQHGHLKLGFDVNTFESGMPFYDFMIDISNSFIEWYNQCEDKCPISLIYNRGIVKTVNTVDGKFYEATGVSREDRHRLEGTSILTFKGESKRLHIMEDEEDVEHTTIINKNLAMYILTHIINILNYRYRNDTNNNSQYNSDSCSTTGASTSACESAYYI